MTCKSYVDKAYRFFSLEHPEGPAGGRDNACYSPPVQAYATKKTGKYAPLIDRLRVQRFQGKRSSEPRFLACIFSHSGEFSAGMFMLIEILASRRFSIASSGTDPHSWLTPKQASAGTRSELKNTVAATIVRGFGAQLMAVGG